MTAYLRQRIKQAQRAYKAHGSLRGVATQFGVSRARVHQWLVLGEQAGMGRVLHTYRPDRVPLLREGLLVATSWGQLAHLMGYKAGTPALHTQKWAAAAGYTVETLAKRLQANRDREILRALHEQCLRLQTPEVNTYRLAADRVADASLQRARRHFGGIQVIRQKLAAYRRHVDAKKAS